MRYLLLVVACATVACTTLRPIDPSSLESTERSLSPQDRITVVTSNGDRLRLIVAAQTGEGLEALSRNGEAVTIAYGEIDQLSVRDAAPGRTWALIGSVVFLLLGAEYVERNYPPLGP